VIFWTQEDEHEMDVDTATSAVQAPGRHPLPEVEIYCYLLVLIFLIDQKRYDEVSSFSSELPNLFFWYKKHILTFPFVLFQAKTCSSASIARLKNMNRRTVDVLASRLYFYYSYSYELTNSLAEIRG